MTGPRPSRPARRWLTWRRGLGPAVALVAIASLVVASGTLAASGIRPIPEEPGTTILDGLSFGAITADLDGDGRPELIRIAPWRVNEGQLAVEVWREATDGSWFAVGQAPLRRGTSPDEQRSAVPHPDAERTLGLTVNDVARLIAWRDGGVERVLAVVNSGTPFNGAPPCCLTVWEVRADRLTGAPLLIKEADTGRGAVDAVAADLDGDGVDELVIREPPDPARPQETPITVLRWTGTGFARRTIGVGGGQIAYLTMAVIGDSDGLPGVEVGLVGQETAPLGWRLTRLSLRHGEISVETTAVDGPGAALAVPGALPGGRPALLFGNDDVPITTLSWPAGQKASVVAVSAFARRGRPLNVLGDAANPWLVIRRSASGEPAIELIRPTLAVLTARAVAASPSASSLVGSPLPPYVGPWPATAGSPGGFVFAGTLLSPAPEGFPAISSIANLGGAAPIGRVGADGSQVVLAEGLLPGAPPIAAEVDRRGGALLQHRLVLLSVVSAAQVLAGEATVGVLAPGVDGAIADPASAGGTALVTGARTFRVIVQAPQGSVAVAEAGDPARLLLLGLPGGGLQDVIDGPPFQIPITAPGEGNGNAAYVANLYLVTPAGHGYHATFSVRLLTTAPSLTAEAGLFSLGLSATVTGRTDPGATLIVDGTAVIPSHDGTYQVSVSAGLTPRDVHVEARDALGHVTARTVSVVGPLDYRRLPWIPIVVVLTVIVALALFLRAPRPGGHPRGLSLDDGTFEEVDPD